MWPNPQFLVDLVKFTEETLLKNFILSAVSALYLKLYFIPYQRQTQKSCQFLG